MKRSDFHIYRNLVGIYPRDEQVFSMVERRITERIPHGYCMQFNGAIYSKDERGYLLRDRVQWFTDIFELADEAFSDSATFDKLEYED